MKYMGIDYGSKRLGLAISDDRGDFSYPFKVLKNNPEIINEISVICKENNVNEIVVGESKNYSQEQNEIMKEINPFFQKLKSSTGLPVYLHPEFMTSMEAERLQGSNSMNDASAASLILKSFLDSKKFNS